MGLLTTENGKAGYLADFIVHAMASTALAVQLAAASRYGVTSTLWDVAFRTNGMSLPHATS
jgi:hypothetical protein